MGGRAPSNHLAQNGATLILNLSASNELVGKSGYRRQLVTGQSGRLVCGYVYADAGEGESTTDLVFTGHNMIAENGSLLSERRFQTGLTISEVDVSRLVYERRRMTTFPGHGLSGLPPPLLSPARHRDQAHPVSLPNPFVPDDAGDRAERCNEILKIAALGLTKRLEHTRARTAVVGLSGGAGLHPGHPHHRRGHEAAGPSLQRHHRRHHALLRHHRPHPGQRHGAGRAPGGHP